MFDIVVAYTIPQRAIGNQNTLPWPKIQEDFRFFKDITSTSRDGMQNAIVMGRKTFESIGSKPLPGRRNVIISNTLSASDYEGVDIVSSFEEALVSAKSCCDRVFVIGGEMIYKIALEHPGLDKIYATEIFTQMAEYDAVFPNIKTNLLCKSNVEFSDSAKLHYRMCEYTRCAFEHPEAPYLDLLQKLLSCGVSRDDRTGVGTVSLFGEQLSFDLSNNTLPLLTTKRVFWRGVVEELLWFIRGDTDAASLQKKKVHIWDGNSSRAFLDSRGLEHREEGDLGPIYGFQWRHFGAVYKDRSSDYTGQGVDQLLDIENKIKNDPCSRRIIMSAWNPTAIPDMALPPCHVLCQFYVRQGELECKMYQRSADVFLGLPFNIASYALLTHILAHRTGLTARKLTITIGDAHLYNNHLSQALQQLTKNPKAFPTLTVAEDKAWDEYEFGDFIVSGYNPHRAIKAEMNA